MESQRKAAADALNEAIAQLHEVVPTANLAEPITLHAVTPYPQVMETTFAREVSTMHLGPRLSRPDISTAMVCRSACNSSLVNGKSCVGCSHIGAQS